mgnify:CR=1 FL=1
MNINYSDKNFEIIFKDYTNRLHEKFDVDKASDINNLVALLNWCFYHKNNFFVENFNIKFIPNVCESYNKLKTNILSKNNDSNIFQNINVAELRRLKFILHNYVQNFVKISNKSENKLLCNIVLEESIRNCIYYITLKIEEKNTSIIKNI